MLIARELQAMASARGDPCQKTRRSTHQANRARTNTALNAAPAAFDCNRVPAPATGIVTNVFDVTDDVLRCNGQPIIDGIEEMQILFGEDIDADSVADRFQAPGGAGLQMNRVVTISINLVARSDQANIATAAADYQLPWWSDEQLLTPDDGRIRREFSTTVAVRNIL